MKRLMMICLAVVLCAGCAMTPWVKAPETEYRSTGLALRVMLPKDWMRYNGGGRIILTKDGVTLNRIIVEKLRFSDKFEYTKRKFTEDMAPLDLAEVELDNLKSNSTISQLTILDNKPASIADHQAYRLEYTYETANGLKMHGQTCGFIDHDVVYHLVFEATEQYYYPKTVHDFEQLVQSLHVIEKGSK
jgi:hypothetical protein